MRRPTSSRHRVALAAEAGCGGIVCAAADLAEARQLAPRDCCGWCRASAGPAPTSTTRPGPPRPRAALDGGADLLVVGRTVTEAEDPAQAAAELVAELTA